MKVSEETALVKESNAIQVLLYLLDNPKLNETQACAEVGITPEAYRYWIRRNPDAMDAVRQFILETQRTQLFEIETSWPRAVSELVLDAVDTSTKTKDRISAMKLLREIKEDLERTHHTQPGVEDEAHQFLKEGPKLTKVKSRMASVEVEPTASGGLRVEVSRYSDLIDSHLSETEPEEATDIAPTIP